MEEVPAHRSQERLLLRLQQHHTRPHALVLCPLRQAVELALQLCQRLRLQPARRTYTYTYILAYICVPRYMHCRALRASHSPQGRRVEQGRGAAVAAGTRFASHATSIAGVLALSCCSTGSRAKAAAFARSRSSKSMRNSESCSVFCRPNFLGVVKVSIVVCWRAARRGLTG
jgi:hypothetical protein